MDDVEISQDLYEAHMHAIRVGTDTTRLSTIQEETEHQEECTAGITPALAQYKEPTTQTTLNEVYANSPHGDSIDQDKGPTKLRIYFQNIRGIATNKSWSQCKQAAQQLRDHQVDITGFAETNVDWTYATVDKATKTFKHHQSQQMTIATSSSTDTTKACTSQEEH
jgi:hypothetical protein